MRRNKWVFALVAALMLVTPLVAAAAPDPGAGTSTVYVQNIDASGSADVTADYINPSTGAADYTDTATVPYAGQEVMSSASAPLPSGWAGSMVLSSTKNIGAVGMTEWTGGAGGDGKTAGAYAGFADGTIKAYAPSLFKRTYQSSKITVQNTDSVNATVTVEFYNRGESTPVHTVTATILPSASKTFDVWDYSQIPQNDVGGGTNNWKGAAVISSPQKIAAVVGTYWQGGTNASSIYSAPTEPAQTLYVPAMFKKLFAQWQIYSGLIILNPGNTTATLTFFFYNRDGTLAVPTTTKTIAPFSSDGFNTRYDADPGEIFAPVSTNWNGLARIESDVPVVGITNNIWKVPSDQTASTRMFTPNDASVKAYYPVANRDNVGGWKKWTGAIFQNTSNSTATVTATFFNANGSQAVPPVTVSIPGNGAAGLNTRYNSDPGEALAGLPSQWVGTVIVEANQKVAGIANLVQNDQAAAYEAIPEP